MAYRGQYTKFGNKTTSQIAALTGMGIGDTVFNTDYGMIEFYAQGSGGAGNVWTNNCSVLVVANTTITEGQVCAINSSGRAILLDNTTTTNAQFGIGVCQYGGTSGQTISLRVCGVAKCKTAANVTIGQYAQYSGTAGSITGTGSPSIGSLGRVLQTTTSGNLCYVMLSFIERA